MEPDLEGYTTLMIIKEVNMQLFTDFMYWIEDWAKGYKHIVMRNTPEGYYELLGKPIN